MSTPGYGSPSSVGLGPGYGSPSSVGLGAGYGDPSGALGLSPIIVGAHVFSDYGGAIVTLTGAFDAGPYYARLLDAGGDLHPSVGYAFGGVPGAGSVITPWVTEDTIQFVLPAVEPAVYQVRIYLDDTGTTWADSANALEVKRRVFAPASYRFRLAFPSRWLGPGPRRIREEHV